MCVSNLILVSHAVSGTDTLQLDRPIHTAPHQVTAPHRHTALAESILPSGGMALQQRRGPLLTSEWVLMWRFRLLLVVKEQEQTIHLYSRSPVWVCWWVVSALDVANVLPTARHT